MIRSALVALAFFLLAACGDGAPARKTTAKLDAVDVQPGTISDSMIILDDASSDGTAVDNSIPEDGNAKASKPDEDSKDKAEAGEESSEDANNNDPAPTAKKVEPE